MHPVIFGVSGLALSPGEAAFFREAEPAGFILFGRNVESPDQVRALVESLKELAGRDAPVLIDQEGGPVQRLKPPHWRAAPAMARFGEVFGRDRELAERALALNCRLIAADLRALGIGVVCAPVLDVPVAGADPVIGERAFSGDPAVVARLGRVAAEAFAGAGVVPVIKHIPGHGRSPVDSHLALPFVSAPRAALEKADFLPFRKCNDMPLAMTAHVVYRAIDQDAPATFSKKVVEGVIRGGIGFGGLIVSDDICMRALAGSFRKRAERTLAAGVDLVLHCSGVRSEMESVMRGVSPMPEKTKTALAKTLEKAHKRPSPERREAHARYAEAEAEMKALMAAGS